MHTLAHAHACARTHTHAHMHAYMHGRTYARTHARTRVGALSPQQPAYRYSHMRACTHTRASTHTCTCAGANTHEPTRTQPRTHTHTHGHAHTHAPTQAHTFTCTLCAQAATYAPIHIPILKCARTCTRGHSHASAHTHKPPHMAHTHTFDMHTAALAPTHAHLCSPPHLPTHIHPILLRTCLHTCTHPRRYAYAQINMHIIATCTLCTHSALYTHTRVPTHAAAHMHTRKKNSYGTHSCTFRMHTAAKVCWPKQRCVYGCSKLVSQSFSQLVSQ